MTCALFGVMAWGQGKIKSGQQFFSLFPQQYVKYHDISFVPAREGSDSMPSQHLNTRGQDYWQPWAPAQSPLKITPYTLFDTI